MDFIPVGLVVSAHGVKGEVKFKYYNEGVGSIDYPSLFVEALGSYSELTLSRIRRQGNHFIIAFNGLDTIEKCAFLLKKELFVAVKDLPSLEEDEYYDYELIGLHVMNSKGKLLGKVSQIMHIRQRDILVVVGIEELLVPMSDDYIIGISRKDGTIQVQEEALIEDILAE
jgi:16S rRNA processing protein RimM